MIGKQIRMERIIDRNTSRTVIVPMDHGVSSGPIYGITDLRDAIEQVVRGGANAIVEHKGMVGAGHRRSGKDVGLIIHIDTIVVGAVLLILLRYSFRIINIARTYPDMPEGEPPRGRR